MSDPVLDDLRRDIASGSVVVVAGAGVAVAASGGASTASWKGLLESGVARAEHLKARGAGWHASIAADMALLSEGDMDGTLGVASKVSGALGGATGAEFKSWLRRDIGDLRVTDRTLIEAITSLNTPIATTNYDSLIEDVTRRDSVTWRDPNGVQMALRGDTKDIVHLHGFWKDSASVILSSMSYGQITAADAAQTLQRSLATLKSFLFIGCGAGLDDPNFEGLRRWMSAQFSQSESRHYRLCSEAELDTLRAAHADERISVLAYGRSHADLPDFVKGLGRHDRSSAVAVHAAAPQRAFDAMCERVRAEAVLADHLRDVETRQLDGLLVPPVLLPVTQEQFTTAQELPREERPKRSDPADDLKNHKPPSFMMIPTA